MKSFAKRLDCAKSGQRRCDLGLKRLTWVKRNDGGFESCINSRNLWKLLVHHLEVDILRDRKGGRNCKRNRDQEGDGGDETHDCNKDQLTVLVRMINNPVQRESRQ